MGLAGRTLSFLEIGMVANGLVTGIAKDVSGVVCKWLRILRVQKKSAAYITYDSSPLAPI